jgi:hypothetical protein
LPDGREAGDRDEESSTVKDLADQAQQDIALAIVTEEEPAVADEEGTRVCVQACPFCGHFPCGCGG